MEIPFDIVVATDVEGGIGKAGRLPWHLSADLKHFKELTSLTQDKDKRNVVIMGRKTWESLPKEFRPLRHRINCVLTRNKDFMGAPGVLKKNSLDALFHHLQEIHDQFERVFVIGGSEIFAQTIGSRNCRKIYLTRILEKFDCDVFFPSLKGWGKESQSPVFAGQSLRYCFEQYIRNSSSKSAF